MKEKTVNLDNHIGVYDNYITREECNRAIELFEAQSKFNNTINRMASEKTSIIRKQDAQYFATPQNIDVWWKELQSMIVNFDLAWVHYMDNTGAKDGYGVDQFYYTNLKIQKTLPTEGYHVWHVEHGQDHSSSIRAFVFSIYLNDVEEGGETEFLHFSKRVKPKAGRVVIWPAGHPYLHRGNPPLKGEKYILTSWMNLK